MRIKISPLLLRTFVLAVVAALVLAIPAPTQVSSAPIGAFDFATTMAFANAVAATSKMTPVTYAFPFESKVALGSLQASAVWPSSSVNCQNGGV